MRNLIISRSVIVCDGLRIHQVPKVACTSIDRAAKGARTGYEFPHEVGKGFRIMFVRHPLDRLVSCWGNARKSKSIANHLGVDTGIGFADFLDAVLPRIHDDQHTWPQAGYAGPWVPFIVPYEQLNEAWEMLRRRFPGLDKLGHRNRSEHDDWASYYTPAMRRRAEQAYAPDMVLYQRGQR